MRVLRGDMTQSEFARHVGIPLSTLRQYETGSQPSIENAARIADAFDVSLDWLVERSGARGNFGLGPGEAGPSDRVRLPRYDIHASAGQGALVVSDLVKEYLSVSREWLRRNLPPWAPPNAVVGVLEGSGDSMEPTIRDGDLIMVVQDVDRRVVERGGIFVLSLDRDRLLLKRLQLMTNGDLTIISDNRNYAPETIPRDQLEDRVIIHGQVFFVGGKPRAL